jgi:hypothetical protein
MNFITFCNESKIILAVFLPHAIHKLQPLDVVLYGPLSGAYSQELTAYLHNSQGLLTVKKGDFFPLFWAAWTLSFTTANILSSFKNTRVIPMDPDMILRKFKSATPEQDQSSNLYEVKASSTGRQVHELIVSTVKDTRSKEAKQLSDAFHSFQTQSELDQHETQV